MLSLTCTPRLALSRPGATCRPARHAPRRCVANAALPPQVMQPLLDLAEAAKPGEVEAPVSAIVIGAVVVTALSFLVSFGLKPGTDEAIKMQARDKKKFSK